MKFLVFKANGRNDCVIYVFLYVGPTLLCLRFCQTDNISMKCNIKPLVSLAVFSLPSFYLDSLTLVVFTQLIIS